MDGCIERVVVNGSESQWTSGTSGVPQGLYWDQCYLICYINDIDEGIECTLSKFADDIKLRDAVDMPEEWDAIQRDAQEVGIWESYVV